MSRWAAAICVLLVLVAVFYGPRLIAQGSTIGVWSGPTAWPILAIHTHVLPNGKVLFWTHDDSIPGRAYLWDPTGGSFTPVADSSTYLFCSVHAFFPDGR